MSAAGAFFAGAFFAGAFFTGTFFGTFVLAFLFSGSAATSFARPRLAFLDAFSTCASCSTCSSCSSCSSFLIFILLNRPYYWLLIGRRIKPRVCTACLSSIQKSDAEVTSSSRSISNSAYRASY
jgi:hypothetical protein